MTELHMPVITTLAAGALGLIFAVLSAMVVGHRTTGKVTLGDGGQAEAPLFVAIRSHSNFAEYVPLGLILIGLIELHNGPTLLVKILAGALVLARIIHPIGMRMPVPNPFRAGGFILSILVLATGGVAALMAVLG